MGVDVFEHDIKLVRPFIEEMGDKMDYSVALDSVPEKGEAKDGAMAKGWMDAADEHGIPTAFVVHDGKIAWIGHPMTMDEPLAKITSGQWSLDDKAKQRLADKAKERKVRLVRQKIFTPYRANDYRATLAAIDEATSSDPDLADEFVWLKFVSLCKAGDIEPALELGSTLLEKYNDNAGRLNSTFWDVIDPALDKEPDPRVAQLALRAARRAVELTNSEDPYYLDTLAEALFRTGDAKAAEATEEKVLQLLKARGKDQSDEDLKEFKEHLDRYRKGAS